MNSQNQATKNKHLSLNNIIIMLYLKIFIYLLFSIALYWLCLQTIVHYIYLYSVVKTDISFLIGFHYGTMLYISILIISSFSWLINNSLISYLIIYILFCIYGIFWYPVVYSFPHRGMAIFIISIGVYVLLHIYLRKEFEMKHKILF